MTAVEYLEYMWILQGAIYKKDIDKALKMEKEQIMDAFVLGEHQQGFEGEAEQYYNETSKPK